VIGPAPPATHGGGGARDRTQVFAARQVAQMVAADFPVRPEISCSGEDFFDST